MEQTQFYTLLERPFAIAEDELLEVEQLLLRYPAFHIGQLLFLQNHYGDSKYPHLLHQRGIHIRDTRHYYQNLMYNKMYPQKDTEVAVETDSEEKTKEVLPDVKVSKEEVLQYAPAEYQLPEQEDEENLQEKIQNEKYDFTDWLTSLEDATVTPSPKKQAEATAKAINRAVPKDEAKEKNYSPEQLMSQTLAEIYVKQQLYDRAITIYKKLYLTDTEKNTIFANRIKEINKLKNK